MTYSEFMATITDCYSNYQSDILEQVTFKYVKERYKESELENIFSTLIIKINPKYKTPPTPADFEELFPSTNIDVEANEWYDRLDKTGNSLDNVIISNKRAEIALESFGGWVAFCQRVTDSHGQSLEGLHRRNFVEAYKKAQHGNEPPKLIYGESSRKYEKAPLMIGDKNICLEILSNKTKVLNTDIFHRIEE